MMFNINTYGKYWKKLLFIVEKKKIMNKNYNYSWIAEKKNTGWGSGALGITMDETGALADFSILFLYLLYYSM